MEIDVDIRLNSDLKPEMRKTLEKTHMMKIRSTVESAKHTNVLGMIEEEERKEIEALDFVHSVKDNL